LVAVQKTSTGTTINIIMILVGSIYYPTRTLLNVFGHMVVHTQAFSYSPNMSSAAHINYRNIISLSGHTVASIG